jgi:hypothetical protein
MQLLQQCRRVGMKGVIWEQAAQYGMIVQRWIACALVRRELPYEVGAVSQKEERMKMAHHPRGRYHRVTMPTMSIHRRAEITRH